MKGALLVLLFILTLPVYFAFFALGVWIGLIYEGLRDGHRVYLGTVGRVHSTLRDEARRASGIEVRP